MAHRLTDLVLVWVLAKLQQGSVFVVAAAAAPLRLLQACAGAQLAVEPPVL
jgi:hypothetical protein